MKEQLAKIEREALEAITGAENPAALEELRVRYLGKKGELTAVLKQMGKLSAQDRPAMGALANEVRSVLEETIELTSQKLAAAALDLKMKAEALDVTIRPGPQAPHVYRPGRDQGHFCRHGLYGPGRPGGGACLL